MKLINEIASSLIFLSGVVIALGFWGAMCYLSYLMIREADSGERCFGIFLGVVMWFLTLGIIASLTE